MFTGRKRWVAAHSQQYLYIEGDRRDPFPSPRTANKSEIRDDPDRIDTDVILSKLEQYQEKSYLPLINPRCECNPVQISGRSAKKKTLRQILKQNVSSSSSSSEDEEEVTYEYLLEKLDTQRRKPPGKSGKLQHKALVNLIKTYKGNETIQADWVHRLIAYLHTEDIHLKEAALILLRQSCKDLKNVKVCIDLGLLNDLELIITTSEYKLVHSAALEALQAMIKDEALKPLWWESLQTLLPSLLLSLQKERLVDIKVAILGVLNTLSHMPAGADWVRAEAMPVLLTMREKNTDIKECFVEILTGLVCHSDPVQLTDLDNNGVSVSLNILQDGPCGPQVRSLRLISTLSSSESGLSDIVDKNLTPYILSALRDSQCRKVKGAAAHAMQCILATRKPGKVKDILTQIVEFFEVFRNTSGADLGGNTSHVVDGQRIVYPVKVRRQTELKLDHGLEKFLKVIADLLCKEGLIERDVLGQPVYIGLAPCVDRNMTMLSTLTNIVGILQSVCCLPWNKSPYCNIMTNKEDAIALADDETTRLMLTRLNPNQTMSVWDICGHSLVEILTAYSRKFKNILHSLSAPVKTSSKASKPRSRLSNQGTLSAADVFEEGELSLIVSLFEILLLFAFCSCENFDNTGDKKYENFKNNNSPSNVILTRPQNLKKVSEGSQRRKNIGFTQSDSSKESPRIVIPGAYDLDIFNQSDDEDLLEQVRLANEWSASPNYPLSAWDPESPREGSHSRKGEKKSFRGHMIKRPTSASKNKDSQLKKQESERPKTATSKRRRVLEKHQLDLIQKEGDAHRRVMRKCLFEAGIFPAVAIFTQSRDVKYKVLASQILRCLIQPLEEKVVMAMPSLDCVAAPDGKSTKSIHVRPQSASAVHDRDKRVNVALYKMSPQVAMVITEALDGTRNPGPLQLLPRHCKLPSTSPTKEKKSFPVVKIPTAGHEKLNEADMRRRHKNVSSKARIDVTLPMANQCRHALLDCAGDALLAGLFSPSQAVKRHTLLLLEDLVSYGDVSVHMKLSEHGCMPKLVDFLRVNDDDELLEITALIVTRIMVSSDSRLKQLFTRHGGSSLLMAMTRYTKGILKEEVTLTLKTVTRDFSRPQSAPASTAQLDIWDQINKRWQYEDKVSEILQQWIK